MTQADAIKKGFRLGGLWIGAFVALLVGGWFFWDRVGQDAWSDWPKGETGEEQATDAAGEEASGKSDENVEEALGEDEGEDVVVDTSGKYELTVYFSNKEKEAETDDGIQVYGLKRYTDDDTVAAFCLRQMLIGPSTEEQGQGYYSELKIEDWDSSQENPFDITISGGLARVNFTKPLYLQSDESARRVTAQIEGSLTQFPTISRVSITVQGSADWDE